MSEKQSEFNLGPESFSRKVVVGNDEKIVWPEKPSQHLIEELVTQYVEYRTAEKKEIVPKILTLALAHFLIGMNVDSDIFQNYEKLMKDELLRRHPPDQTEFDIDI